MGPGGDHLRSVKCRHGHDLCRPCVCQKHMQPPPLPPQKKAQKRHILQKNKKMEIHARPFFFQKHIQLLFLEVRLKTSTPKIPSKSWRGWDHPPDGFCGGMSMRNKRSSARASVEFKRSSAALPPIEEGLEGGLSWEMVEMLR